MIDKRCLNNIKDCLSIICHILKYLLYMHNKYSILIDAPLGNIYQMLYIVFIQDFMTKCPKLLHKFENDISKNEALQIRLINREVCEIILLMRYLHSLYNFPCGLGKRPVDNHVTVSAITYLVNNFSPPPWNTFETKFYHDLINYSLLYDAKSGNTIKLMSSAFTNISALLNSHQTLGGTLEFYSKFVQNLDYYLHFSCKRAAIEMEDQCFLWKQSELQLYLSLVQSCSRLLASLSKPFRDKLFQDLLLIDNDFTDNTLNSFQNFALFHVNSSLNLIDYSLLPLLNHLLIFLFDLPSFKNSEIQASILKVILKLFKSLNSIEATTRLFFAIKSVLYARPPDIFACNAEELVEELLITSPKNAISFIHIFDTDHVSQFINFLFDLNIL
ncbi:uncharacterized protein LOC135931932 isoform X2 [Gordionus sp. m RMFG-2023]|uniref:uncharacterized protein LOC135931932 isoform X2 n=1 Tax=Gordionus sp. m RMFG-2023 TaxID=3053472 RepID=UPI0031FC1D33